MRISDWSSDVCSSDLLRRRSDRGVTRILAVHRDQQLGVVKELRDVVLALVADQLTASLLQILGRTLILNDDEGDAVDEADDIAEIGRASCRESVCKTV